MTEILRLIESFSGLSTKIQEINIGVENLGHLAQGKALGFLLYTLTRELIIADRYPKRYNGRPSMPTEYAQNLPIEASVASLLTSPRRRATEDS